ncbi:hypothetical protein ACEZ3G_01660 [Maribacter algicola]|uniref:Uncharacterized protein n=1 Tax=Meishania litoralis TaxID=3434685 RepID=A0ACC7LG83_9FLAO
METKELKNFKKISLNVVLTDPDRYQLIYASQLYSTFFGVAGKFKVENDKLKEIDISLVNYKGAYNLGLLQKTEDSWNCQNGVNGQLCLHIKANGGLHGHRTNQNIKVKCDTDIKNLKDMMVSRELYPIYDNIPSDFEEHLHHPMFDSEFYERDGIAIRKRDRLDNQFKPNTVGKCKNSLVYFLK